MMRVLTAKWARELAKERSLSWGLCVHDGMYCIGTIDQLQAIGCAGIVPAGWCCTAWPDCDCGARDNEDHLQADKWAMQRSEFADQQTAKMERELAARVARGGCPICGAEVKITGHFLTRGTHDTTQNSQDCFVSGVHRTCDA